LQELAPIKLRTYGALTLIAAMATLPFLWKPAHIDDPFYIAIARRALVAPLDPYGEPPPWGMRDWFTINSNPLLWPYLLAGAAKAAGESERTYHVVAAVFSFAFVFGLYALARRVSKHPLGWTVIGALSPFLLPGQNLMAETPMLAFWVWSLAIMFHVWEDGRPAAAWPAGFLAGAACLTKYTAGLMGPLALFGSWRYRRWVGLWALVPLTLLLAAWCVFLRVQYQQWPIGSQELGGSVPWHDKVRILLRGVGSVLWISPLWTAVVAAQNRRSTVVVLAVCLASLAFGVYDGRLARQEWSAGGPVMSQMHFAHFVVFSANGMAATLLGGWLLITRSLRPDGKAVSVLAMWAALALAFNLFVIPRAPFGAIRHLAFFLLPMALAAAPAVDEWALASRGRRWLRFACSAVSVGLAFLLADADLTLAKVYPQIAGRYATPTDQHQRIWIVGDVGMRYHGEERGARGWSPGLTGSPAPADGDLVVIPTLQGLAVLTSPQWRAHLQHLHTETFRSPNPLRTVWLSTNYYGATNVSLPWQAAIPAWPEVDRPIEEANVFRYRQ
jgi:hypothetical protein